MVDIAPLIVAWNEFRTCQGVAEAELAQRSLQRVRLSADVAPAEEIGGASRTVAVVFPKPHAPILGLLFEYLDDFGFGCANTNLRSHEETVAKQNAEEIGMNREVLRPKRNRPGTEEFVEVLLGFRPPPPILNADVDDFAVAVRFRGTLASPHKREHVVFVAAPRITLIGSHLDDPAMTLRGRQDCAHLPIRAEQAIAGGQELDAFDPTIVAAAPWFRRGGICPHRSQAACKRADIQSARGACP